MGETSCEVFWELFVTDLCELLNGRLGNRCLNADYHLMNFARWPGFFFFLLSFMLPKYNLHFSFTNRVVLAIGHLPFHSFADLPFHSTYKSVLTAGHK